MDTLALMVSGGGGAPSIRGAPWAVLLVVLVVVVLIYRWLND